MDTPGALMQFIPSLCLAPPVYNQGFPVCLFMGGAPPFFIPLTRKWHTQLIYTRHKRGQQTFETFVSSFVPLGVIHFHFIFAVK